jgi:hypothetical protein
MPYRNTSARKPHVESQLLPEPDLLFGYGGLNPNPKFGLAEYGPYDLPATMAAYENSVLD